MSPIGWVPPEEERFLGLGFYATFAPGVGGRLKREPADFQVDELSAYPLPVADGPVTVLRIQSQGWEQHELTGRLAHELGIPASRIRWAGTKDRRAITDRLVSYRGEPPSPGRINIPRVEVREAYQARDELVLGHHYGNRFHIRLHEVPGTTQRAIEEANAVRAEFATTHGFPNFFGAQRFGEVRPITHTVGHALVQGAVGRALEIYLCEIPPGEVPIAAEARRSYAEHRSPARALREFPASFQFERTLLDHLDRGHPPERALRALGRPLRTLFIHAYQAHIFNRFLTRRRENGLSLTDPAPGDWLLRVARDGTVPGREPVPASEDNLAEARTLVARDRARLVGPLVGYSTPPLGGPAGDLLESILAEDGVSRDQFRLPSTPEISSAGNWRPFWCPAPPIDLGGDPTASETVLRFRFNLPRGTYATVLMREFMKRGAGGPRDG